MHKSATSTIPCTEPRGAARVARLSYRFRPNLALSPGDTAPDISLIGSDLLPFSLESTRVTGPVVLLFFPGAFTSVCTTELNTVSHDIVRYGDATIVGISTDLPFALAEFKRVHNFPFRLLSDHEGTAVEAYGALNEHIPGRVARRAAFVVAPDGSLAYAEVLESDRDQPDFDAIVDALGGVSA